VQRWVDNLEPYDNAVVRARFWGRAARNAMLTSYEADGGGSFVRPRYAGLRLPTQVYFGVLIVIVGVALGREALNGDSLTHWLLLWCALACALVSTAYLANWPGVFGKRADGTLNRWVALPVLPYQAFFWLYWQGERYFSRLAPYTEVAPGLYVGRRLLSGEMPARVDMIVDLTSEFSEPAIRSASEYVCLPTLDGSVPPCEKEFAQLLQRIAKHSGVVLVHCASGRGRAVATVAGALILRGLSADIAGALEHIRKLRPGIRPTPTQREMVARVTGRILRMKRETRIARVRAQSDNGGVGPTVAVPAY
jgi:protein-tyrosine phosphatase